jgi:multicomponent Na+:H+ antiporter subunit G
MNPLSVLSLLSIAAGACFFVAGSLGMLRFPDAFTRLHATTKADNVGLGLVIVGLLLQTESFYDGAKLVAVWLLVAQSGAAACHLIARAALHRGVRPWSRT